jgi:hypothetical protein
MMYDSLAQIREGEYMGGASSSGAFVRQCCLVAENSAA